MDEDLWRRVERVFHAAVAHPSEIRPAFLDDACGDEPELRELVEALLSHDDRAGTFLEQPLIDTVDPPAPAPGALVGCKHGPYHIVSLLGAGGMGEVYRAQDEKLGRDVAIKTLPPAFARDPLRLARLRSEARALAALNHPNISAIYGLEESEDVSYLVLELVEGTTPRGPLPLAVVLDLACQLAEALQAAHERGIIHRDLKPANLKVTPGGRLKILDFGLARETVKPADAPAGSAFQSCGRGTTVLGRIQGTPGYMSPEQACGHAVDHRTDIWAFGCVFYELLTGTRAFSSRAAPEAGPLPQQEPDWSALPPGTPALVADLLRHCLQRDPNLRLNDIARARAMVGEAQQQLRARDSQMPLSPEAPVIGSARTPGANPPGHPGVLIAWAILLALAVTAITFMVSRPTRPASVVDEYALAMTGATSLAFSASSRLAVSADGSGVVYLGRSGEQNQLYWHDLGGSDGWALEGTEGASTPFLSPDASWLGFFREGKILKVPLRAGRVATDTPVTEVAAAASLRGAAWSADGRIVYGTIRGGLWEVSASGHDTPRRLTEPDRSKGDGDHRWPSFLPGGRDLLFTIQPLSGRNDQTVLAVLSDDTRQVRRLSQRGSYGRFLPPGHLVFGSHGTLMAVPFDVRTHQLAEAAFPLVQGVSFGYSTGAFTFDVTKNGTIVYARQKAVLPDSELVWVSREGEVQAALPGRRPYDPLNFALAPDGTRVSTSIMSSSHISLWVWNLQDGRGVRMPIDADCGSPVWSPAGDRLIFSSNHGGAFNLYTASATGGESPRRIGQSPMMQRPRSWSSDGRLLAYEVQTPSSSPLETHILDIDAGLSWRFGPEGADISEPAFAPDGRWLVYQSRESGTWEVWVRPVTGDEPRYKVSGPLGGVAPAWVGSEIYYVERPNDTRIMSRSVQSTAPLRLAPSARVAFALPFTLANNNPYLSLAYAIAPDRRRVLVVRPDRQASDEINSLNVMPNWRAVGRARLLGSSSP